MKQMHSEDLNNTETLQPGVDDYIKFQELLKLRCQQLKGVRDVRKLERKIHAEMKFLISLRAEDEATQRSHMKSSNLSHFSSIVHSAELLPGVVQVLQRFDMPTRTENLVVDIVAVGGRFWVKVIARKAQALHLVWAGQGQFGERDLISQAEEYLTCAALHPFEFNPPQVHFSFYNQVTEPMAECLRNMGIFVWGKVVPVDKCVQDKLELESDDGRHLDDSGSDDSLNDFLINLDVQTKSEMSSCISRHIDKDVNNSRQNTLNTGVTKCTKEEVGEGSSCFHEKFYNEPTSCVQVGHLSSSSGRDHEENSEVCPEFHTNNDLDIFKSAQMSYSINRWHSQDRQTPFSELQSDHMFQYLVCSPPDYCQLVENCDQSLTSVSRVNLDITALIALVSSVTNGNCHFIFPDKVLNLQALEERENPVLPRLKSYLQDKEVFVCETAVSSFQSILGILGGQAEKKRALDLLASVKVVKDEPSQRALALDCQGRVKERSKVIFGTGDSLQAVTITSNMGFVRAAKSQGVLFSVFLHQARALTEAKELQAKPLTEK